MPRLLLLAILLLALVGTGLLALTLLDRGASGRLDREREAREAPSERPRGDAPSHPPNARRGADAPGRGWIIGGGVRDRDGRPVPGAVVRASGASWQKETRTGEEGGYELEPLEPAFAFDVYALGYLPLVGVMNGRSNGTLDYVFDGDGPWTRDFTLEIAAALAGRVVGPNGEPVPGATVYVISAEHQVLDSESVANVVHTGREGAYVFPGLEAGVTDVGVRANGYLPKMDLDVEIPESGTAIRDLVLRKGRSIRVTVEKDPGLVCVRAADSRLRSMLLPPGGPGVLDSSLVGRAFIDYPVVREEKMRDGVYLLDGVGLGPADVAAVCMGPRIVEDGVGRLLDTIAPELTLRLLHGAPIMVTVRDVVTGKELEPEVVRVSDGKTFPFTFVPLDDRRHVLRFTLDGYEPAELALPKVEFRDPPQHFDVVMYPTIEGDKGAFYVVFEPPLEGRVALVGRDATGEVVWVRHLDNADSEGRWAVPPVPVGEYAVTVLATRMIPVVLPRVVVTSALKETYRVRIERGGGLSIRVTDQQGELLDKVHVLLKDGQGNPIDIHVMTRVSDGRAFVSVNYLPSAATATADSGLAPGTYSIVAGREDYAPAAREFTIAGTEIAEVAIALGRP